MRCTTADLSSSNASLARTGPLPSGSVKITAAFYLLTYSIHPMMSKSTLLCTEISTWFFFDLALLLLNRQFVLIVLLLTHTNKSPF